MSTGRQEHPPVSPKETLITTFQSQLDSLSIPALFYALLVIFDGFVLGSVKYAGPLVGYWAVMTASTWIMFYFGWASARRRGGNVGIIRVGLGCLFWMEVMVGLLLLPDDSKERFSNLRDSYGALGYAPPVIVAVLLGAVHYALDLHYVKVITQAARREVKASTLLYDFLGLVRHITCRTPEQSSGESFELPVRNENHPGNFQTWLSRVMPLRLRLSMEGNSIEKEHLLNDTDLDLDHIVYIS